MLLYCSKCDEIFEDADQTKQWNCRKCEASLLLQCFKCAKRYTKVRTIYRHLKMKCAAQKRYHCADCDYMSTSKGNLKIHIKHKHTVVDPENYEKCSKCDLKFKFRSNLRQHEKRCGQEELLQCELCPHKSKTMENFKRHMQDHLLHPQSISVNNAITPVIDNNGRIKVNAPKPISKKDELKIKELTKTFCSKCNKSVKYVKHSKRQCNKCTTQLIYLCNKCSKSYSHFFDLRVHVIHKHLRDELKKRQQCTICSKRFTLYDDMRADQKRCVKQPNLQCDHCPFITKYRNNIAEHLKNKHGEKKKVLIRSRCVGAPKQFACPNCGRGYISESGLRKHKQFYCGKEQSFTCDHCSFKSFWRTSLINHLQALHYQLFIDQELKCRHCGKENSNIYMHNNHVANCSCK